MGTVSMPASPPGYLVFFFSPPTPGRFSQPGRITIPGYRVLTEPQNLPVHLVLGAFWFYKSATYSDWSPQIWGKAVPKVCAQAALHAIGFCTAG